MARLRSLWDLPQKKTARRRDENGYSYLEVYLDGRRSMSSFGETTVLILSEQADNLKNKKILSFDDLPSKERNSGILLVNLTDIHINCYVIE